MAGLEPARDPNLLVGLSEPDDAAVYRLTPDLALVHTVDFMTPIVDDPYTFGQIAAANSLSDVYAMGGVPTCALSVACFPAKTLDLAILAAILRGAADMTQAAGAVLAGGHTVDDPEVKFGLAVAGLVHPAHIWPKRGAAPGDRLVLTKPLGTGIVHTAMKAGLASPAAVDAMVRAMLTLNRGAAEALRGLPVHAATDVTGFGLAGHAAEMLAGSGLSLHLDAAALPLLPDVPAYAEQGLLCGGLHRNRDFRRAMVRLDPALPRFLDDVLFDPQTSGGLLVALPPAAAEAFAAAPLTPPPAIIGTFVPATPECIGVA